MILIAGYFACTPKLSSTLEDGNQEPVAEAQVPESPEVELPPEPEVDKSPMDERDPMLDPVPIDQRVVIGQLPNGLKYYIQKNAKPEDRAELRLAVGVGSINEDDDQLGLAHFVEHMAFNGTKNFEKSELIDYLQKVGTRFGPDLNAYTSFDETVYMLQVRTDSQDLFDKGMLILEDWAHAVTFEDEEIDKERGVVESELRSGLSAEERMRNQYLPILFYKSRYADRLPIGTREIINGAPYDALKRYYRDWYRPDLMALVVVGDVNVDEVEADIRERFSKLANPENPRPREKYGFPDHEETLISISKDKEASFTRAQVIHKHPHVKVENLGDYRSSLVRNIYNRMLSDRLNELRQSADPPFLFASSGYGRFVGNLDTYSSSVVTAEGELLRGLRSVFEENRRVLLHGFTASELERVKTEMLSEAETTAKEEDKLESGRLSMQYVYHFLNENPVPSPQQRLQLRQAFFPTIALDEVNALASKWITEENKVVVVTGPDKEDVPLPTEDKIRELMVEVDAADIEPYEDDVVDIPLLADVPAHGAIVSENFREEVEVTELELSNGVRVILRPTDFQNDEIMFNAFSPGGTSLYSDDDYRSASIAATIINQSGISEFDLIQLQKLMAGKVANASPYIGELEEGLQGFSTIKDLETMFQLIYLYFHAPREDSSAFASFVNRQRAVLQNLFVNPDYYYQDRMSDLKYNNHKRRGIPHAEEMDEIQFEKVMKIYRDRFADASDFTFTFVGNFTVESIKPLITTYLGNLPSSGREETWKDVGADLVKGKHVDRFTFGEAPKAQANLTWHGPFDWDIREDRYHFDAMLDVLRNVLRESMREDQGGVYGVRVSGGVSKYPKEDYSITISFNAEPDEVDTLIQTAMKDIKRLINEGPKDEDLEKVVEVQRQSRIKNLKENGFWANSLRTYYSYGLEPEGILLRSYEPLLKELDTKDIQMMVKRCFETENYIEVVMLPEAGE